MNAKSIFLAVSLIALGQALPAHAEGPRWDFEPNKYGTESHQNMKKHQYVQPHAVQTGSMPHSNAFLAGLSPSSLAPKPVAPPPTQAVQASISVPQVQAAPFKNDFGAPISEQHANPTAMAPAKSAPAQYVATSGHARLRTPVHAISQHAIAHSMPRIETYNQGFTPGVAVPQSVGSGSSASTAVNGRIVGH
jgi:hypothetical protein